MKESDFDHPCKETCSGWRQGRERGVREGMERAADICIETWKNASNINTDDIRTAFIQNSISHGCEASAKAIRKAAEQIGDGK